MYSSLIFDMRQTYVQGKIVIKKINSITLWQIKQPNLDEIQNIKAVEMPFSNRRCITSLFLHRLPSICLALYQLFNSLTVTW